VRGSLTEAIKKTKNIFNPLAAVIYKIKRNAAGSSEKVVRPCCKMNTYVNAPELEVCCKLSRNQPTGLRFQLLAMIETGKTKKLTSHSTDNNHHRPMRVAASVRHIPHSSRSSQASPRRQAESTDILFNRLTHLFTWCRVEMAIALFEARSVFVTLRWRWFWLSLSVVTDH